MLSLSKDNNNFTISTEKSDKISEYILSNISSGHVLITPMNPCPFTFDEFMNYIRNRSNNIHEYANKKLFYIHIEYINNDDGYKGILLGKGNKFYILQVGHKTHKGILNIKQITWDTTYEDKISLEDCTNQCFTTLPLENYGEIYSNFETRIKELEKSYNILYEILFEKCKCEKDVQLTNHYLPYFVKDNLLQPKLTLQIKGYLYENISILMLKLKECQDFCYKLIDMGNYCIKANDVKISFYDYKIKIHISFSFITSSNDK